MPKKNPCKTFLLAGMIYRLLLLILSKIFLFFTSQFEIVGQMANTSITETNFGYPFVNGKRKYARILIRKK